MFTKPVRDLVAVYLSPHRPRLSLLAVPFVAGVGLQLANPLLAKSFIDQAMAGAPFHELVRIAAVFLGVALLTQVATVAEVHVAEDLGWRTTNALRLDLTWHVLRLDDRFHSDHGAGELLERIDGDVGAIAGFFARFVVHVLGSALFLVGVLVLLWSEDWRIGAMLTVIALPALAHLTRGGDFVGRRSRAARATSADFSAFLEERLCALPDIKANEADAAAQRDLQHVLARRFRVDRDAILAASLFSGATHTALVIATAAGLALAAARLRAGAITVGGVYLVFRYTGMLRIPLERLARHMNSLQRAMGGIVRVRELLAIERRITDGPGPPLPPGPLSLELDDVTFGYDHEPVLRQVSLLVPPGTVLGLLGRTGSGKTTVARLLLRLYDAGEGRVCVGGVDVRRLRVDDLRRRIGLVTQDVQLFAGTLRDNVRLFDDGVDDERLREVFAALDLDGWLAALPDGLDTVLGPTARGLSAGEEQLVAMSRVFLGDPGVVILDEASSRLDPHTEALLERAVDRLLRGRTGVVIAHGLRTIQRADHVALLAAGRIVEQGDREALAADPTSRFAALVRAGRPEGQA